MQRYYGNEDKNSKQQKIYYEKKVIKYCYTNKTKHLKNSETYLDFVVEFENRLKAMEENFKTNE